MVNFLNNSLYFLAGTPNVAEQCTAGSDLVKVIAIVRLVINAICIVVPIVLILLGAIDLFRAVIASKEEDIKKNQQRLIKRVIAGIIVFLVPTIITVLLNLIGVSNGWKKCWDNAKNQNFSTLFNN